MNNPDLLIVGGGPAGLGAAIEAGRRGADVLLVDENGRPGGQLFKQIHKFFGSKEHYAGTRGYDIGNTLLEDAEDAGVNAMLSTRVLGVFPDRRTVLLPAEGGAVTLKPRLMLIATGGIERGIAFPGWTLPGVITAGAAQTLCNIHRVLPGRRVVMMGAGNVGLIVAFQLLQAGAEVPCIVDVKQDIGGYGVHAAKIMRAGVSVLTGHTVKEVRGKDCVEEVVVSAIDASCSLRPGTERAIEADTLCLAVGLYSDSRLAAMAGCRLVHSGPFGGFVPQHDEHMETSVPGIYVAGDGAGVEEANTALEEGRIAGISAAMRLGKISEKEGKQAVAEIWCRLMALRSGSFGVRRSTAKAFIMNAGMKERHSAEDAAMADRSLGEQREQREQPERQELPPAGKGKQPVAVIYCSQDIPCNPCVAACPFNAITIVPDVTGLPILNSEACTGCARCLAVCPGQAIFLFQEEYDAGRSAITFVYEFLPLPAKGDTVRAVDRFGTPVCTAEVIRVLGGEKTGRSPLVSIAFDTAYADCVRFIERKVR